jgi:prephenate dehydratase
MTDSTRKVRKAVTPNQRLEYAKLMVIEEQLADSKGDVTLFKVIKRMREAEQNLNITHICHSQSVSILCHTSHQLTQVNHCVVAALMALISNHLRSLSSLTCVC